MATKFNPFDPDFARDPYPTYADLRRSGSVARARIGFRPVLGMLFRAIASQRRRGRIGSTLKFAFYQLTSQRGPRPEHRPGLRSRLYTVSHYDDVSFVLRHPEIFSSEIMGGSKPQVMSAIPRHSGIIQVT